MDKRFGIIYYWTLIIALFKKRLEFRMIGFNAEIRKSSVVS